MTKLTLEVLTLSDTHVGTGLGDGTIDRTIARDASGIPLLPATTLRGVLRERSRRIAGALDVSLGGGSWSEVHAALYGHEPALGEGTEMGPRPGALRLHGGEVAPAVRGHLREHGDIGLTAVRTMVALDPELGIAKDDHLRTLEVLRAGVRFVAPLELDRDALGDAAEAALALLAVTAAGLERLGSGRRRGLGRVRVRLVRDDWCQPVDAATAERLLGLPAPRPAAVEGRGTTVPAGSGIAPGTSATASGPWDRVWLRMTTVDPVLVPRRTVGNVVESDDRVRGRVLLPLVGEALASIGIDLGALLRADAIRVGDALPVVGRRAGLPTPFCLLESRASETLRNALAPAGHHPGFKPMRGGVIVPVRDGLVRSSVPRTLRLHNSIDDETGRVGDAARGGGLFGVETIDPGTSLAFSIALRRDAVEDATALARLVAALTGTRSIGTARRGGHGRVRIEVGDGTVDPLPGLRRDTPLDGERRLVAWLMSDCSLLDGASLAPDPTVGGFSTALARRLGLDATEVTLPEDPAAFVRTDRLDAWHARWGTSRATLPVLSAGSVIPFDLARGVDGALLEELAVDGVGERRGEGLGRVVVLPRDVGPAATSTFGRIARRDAPKGSVVEDLPLAPEDVALMEALDRARSEDALATMLLEVARPRNQHPVDLSALSRTQLGGLRAAASRARELDEPEVLAKRVERALANLVDDEKRTRRALERILRLLGPTEERERELRDVLTEFGASSVRVPTERHMWLMASLVIAAVRAADLAERGVSERG